MLAETPPIVVWYLFIVAWSKDLKTLSNVKFATGGNMHEILPHRHAGFNGGIEFYHTITIKLNLKTLSK